MTSKDHLRPGISNRTPALTAGIILVLAVVAANAMFSFNAIRQLARDQQWVVHTMEVIGELQATLHLVTDAETSHRGYLLTGNPDYLAPYQEAIHRVPGHLDRIQELTRDNGWMQSRMPELRQLMQEKMAISRDAVEAAERGDQTSARASMMDGSAKANMDQIRDLSSQMLSQENELLENRVEAARRSLRDALLTSSLASLVAVIFVVAFYMAAKREVRERVKEARAVEERESWLNTTLNSIADAVIATDVDRRIMFMNRAAEKLIGSSNQECSHRPIGEVFRIFQENTGAPMADPVDEALREGFTGLGERIFLRNSHGEEVPIEDSAAPILGPEGEILGAVLVFRDLTSRRMAQESARRSEKLAATGRLAATIAHEINNPLEAATNFIFLAKTTENLDDSRRYLAGADLELARAAHITRKALSFYRDSSRPVVTNVATLLEEVMTIYGGRVRSAKVQVKVQCDRDVELLTLRGELIQIVSNLVSNAIDAMRPGGLLTIRATTVDKGICLEVEDTGEGIPGANRAKVFDAFFTTKKDIGTGLGLWVVKDLVQKQGGTITLESETEGPARGAKFSIYLPSMLAPAPVQVSENKAS